MITSGKYVRVLKNTAAACFKVIDICL